MRRSLFLILTIALCASALALGQGENAAPDVDVLAVVNGQQISRADVERAYKNKSTDNKRKILAELIDTELLVQRSKSLGLEATDGEVEDSLSDARAGYTEEQFQRHLAEQGVNADSLRRELGRQISAKKLLNREVISKVSITDEDIAAFYSQNRRRFTGELTDPLVMSSVRVALWERTVNPLATAYVASLRSQAKINKYLAPR